MCIHDDSLDHLITDFLTVREVVCVKNSDQTLELNYDNIEHLILSNMIENEDDIEITEQDIIAQAKLCNINAVRVSDLYIDKYDKNNNLLYQLN